MSVGLVSVARSMCRQDKTFVTVTNIDKHMASLLKITLRGKRSSLENKDKKKDK